jgi:hypothetical protein
MEDLVKLQYHLSEDNVQAALEMSKRGGHLWVFLKTPLLARECRIYVYNLALRLGLPVKGAGLAEGIEVFPKHDELRPGEFGNAMRGPLGIHRGANRRYWFYEADYDLEEQMAYLEGLRKVTEEELRHFIVGKTMPAELSHEPRSPEPVMRCAIPGRPEFRILDHVGKVRKVGRNYVTRCPSCAEAGQDRSGDNLAIRIDDPRFYKCWAGCTKEMIREAVGCPIRMRRSAEVRAKESMGWKEPIKLPGVVASTYPGGCAVGYGKSGSLLARRSVWNISTWRIGTCSGASSPAGPSRRSAIT